MIIGGLQKFSLLDYPEHLSAIIFTKGCNFSCQFCYNPMLVWPACNANMAGRPEEVGKLKNTSSLEEENKKVYSQILEDDLFGFLKSRVKKLDAVVITGGEPTIQPDLGEFIYKIKKLGFKVKLDTNGTNPEMLNKLIKEKLVDYIAMDIKSGERNYDLITRVSPDLSKIKKSIIILKEASLPYEFRTTVVPELINIEDVKEIGELIKGANRWYLQKFKSDTELLNKEFEGFEPYSNKKMEEICRIASKYVEECGIR